MAQILDGKKLAKKFLVEIKKEVKRLKKKPRLLVFLVGKDHASEIFVRAKERACLGVGIDFVLERITAQTPTLKICEIIKQKDKEESPDGIVVQLPLPRGVNVDQVLRCIPSTKDVDSLTSDLVESPLVLAIITLLSEYGIEFKDRKVVVVGAGRLVGQPVSNMARRLGGLVKVCDLKTKNLQKETQGADILISGVGKPGLIRASMIRQGAVVVDAGTSFLGSKVKGDVNFPEVLKKASFITPVPGGVGPMTVVMLLTNLIELTKIKN